MCFFLGVRNRGVHRISWRLRHAGRMVLRRWSLLYVRNVLDEYKRAVTRTGRPRHDARAHGRA